MFLPEKLVPEDKVSRPNSITRLKQTLIFEWCVIRCGYEKGEQKDMCVNYIGLPARNLLRT